MSDNFWQEEAKRLAARVMELEEDLKDARFEMREKLRQRDMIHNAENFLIRHQHELLVEIASKYESLKTPKSITVPSHYSINGLIGIAAAPFKTGDVVVWGNDGKLYPSGRKEEA